MNWSAIVASFTSTRSILNMVLMFLTVYGAATLLHLPGSPIEMALVAAVANQVGLHQTQPGA